MRIIITVLCVVFLGSLLMPYAYDKPGSKSINPASVKGSDMSNTKDALSGGIKTLPVIDTLKPAKTETATFALG
jgi:hypothetical protein